MVHIMQCRVACHTTVPKYSVLIAKSKLSPKCNSKYWCMGCGCKTFLKKYKINDPVSCKMLVLAILICILLLFLDTQLSYGIYNFFFFPVQDTYFAYPALSYFYFEIHHLVSKEILLIYLQACSFKNKQWLLLSEIS